MKINKVVRISLAGGLIGMLTTNPRRALDKRIENENKDGWNAIYFMPHKETNLLVSILQIVLLVVTLGLWTWGAGYFVLFERQRASSTGLQSGSIDSRISQ